MWVTKALVVLIALLAVAVLDGEDRKYITEVNSQVKTEVVRDLDFKMDQRLDECIQKVDTTRIEGEKYLEDYKNGFIRKMIFGIFGAVYASIFSSLILINRMKAMGKKK